jgi:aarF domain-containing kinase
LDRFELDLSFKIAFQVHRAVSLDGKPLAIKVQYPGVANGIDADIDNLLSILKFGGLLPKGMFLQEFVSVSTLKAV